MKNEITTTKKATPAIKNLNQATTQIIKLEESSNRNLYKIALIMNQVKKSEMYKEQGFKTLVEYANVKLGYQKSLVYALTNVADRFLLDNGVSILKKIDEKDYSITQLSELLPLDDETVKKLDEDGEINPYLSAKKIRDVVKTCKSIVDTQEAKEVEEDETETHESDSSQPENDNAFENTVEENEIDFEKECEELREKNEFIGEEYQDLANKVMMVKDYINNIVNTINNLPDKTMNTVDVVSIINKIDSML